jgi:outer membrane receptor protein involved in Fe transport
MKKNFPLPAAILYWCWLTIVQGVCPVQLFAQGLSTATVEGLLHDDKGKPVEFATLLLLRPDSTMAKGSISDAEGKYYFENVVPGTYRVVVSLVGYERTQSGPVRVEQAGQRVQVPLLTTKEASQMLGEVQIRGQKPFIEQLPDKTVINVENSPIASGGTALEVLERAPGVVVDAQNERLSLKGREGTLVMLDGKPTYLSAQEVINLLRNTPANGVESIELITNPSARYDAAGNAGIINIRLKRGASSNGTKGALTWGGGYGRYPKASVGTSLNYRQGKWSLFGNYNFDYRKSFGSVDARRYFGTGDSLTTVRNLGYRPNSSHNNLFKAGGDYAISKRTSVGFMLNGMVNANEAVIDNKNLVYNAQNQLTETVTMINASERSIKRLSGNLNFRHAFDTLGRVITVDLDASRVAIDPRDNMNTRYLGIGGEEIKPRLVQRNIFPSTISIKAAKADYTHPLKNGLKLETGAKVSYVSSDNNVRFETLTGGTYLPDPQRTNQFLYDETIAAGYLNASQEVGKWALQAGLRAEQTLSVGNSITMEKVVDRSYLNFFPSAFVTYNASKEHQWRASYSRRIDRPNYQDLNPFIYVMDPYTYREGNPFLRPQYTNAYQLGYTYKGETNISLSYNHTTDVITGVNDQIGQVIRVTTVNLASLYTYNLDINAPIRPTRWWTLRPSLNLSLNAYDAVYANTPLTYRRMTANVNLSQNFVLPHGFTAELTGFYNSPSVYGQMYFGSQGQLNFGLQKSLWKKAALVRFNVSDLFYTARNVGTINFAGTNLSFVGRRESRVATLSFTYNFGNRNIKLNQPRRSGVEDEQGRIGG